MKQKWRRIHEQMPIKLTIGALQNLTFNAILEYISPKGVETNGANRTQFEIKAAVTHSGFCSGLSDSGTFGWTRKSYSKKPIRYWQCPKALLNLMVTLHLCTS